MRRIMLLFLLVAPLLISAQKGYEFEYLLNVSGIDNASTLKLIYQAINDLDSEAEISHNDLFVEIKVRTNLRLDENDLTAVLEPLDVFLIKLGTPRTYRSTQDQIRIGTSY